MKYTVVWSPDAVARLAALWQDNPAIRGEFSEAANSIDDALGRTPHDLGDPDWSGKGSRLVVRPPISMLFVINEDDRLVEVIEIKLWDE